MLVFSYIHTGIIKSDLGYLGHRGEINGHFLAIMIMRPNDNDGTIMFFVGLSLVQTV